MIYNYSGCFGLWFAGLKVEVLRSSKTLVITYKTTSRHIPEDQNTNSHATEILPRIHGFLDVQNHFSNISTDKRTKKGQTDRELSSCNICGLINNLQSVKDTVAATKSGKTARFWAYND